MKEQKSPEILDAEIEAMNEILKCLMKIPDATTRAWILGITAHKVGCEEQAREIAGAIARGYGK